MRARIAFLLVLLALVPGCTDDPAGPAPPEQARPAYDLLVQRNSNGGAADLVMVDPATGAESPYPLILPTGAFHMTPSPDGQRLVFLAQRDAPTGSGLHLWTVRRDGSGLLDLFDGLDADVHGMSWSPSGDRLVYAAADDHARFDIWVMNADGSDRVALTRDPLPDVWTDVFPSWSPDGGRITFTSNRNGFHQVWVMDADGGNARAIGGQLPGIFGRWDSAGTRLAFVTLTDDNRSAIAVARVDGSGLDVFPQDFGVTGPVWTPDGRVLFIGNPTGSNSEVMALDPSTGATVNLSRSAANEAAVSILPRITEPALVASNRE